MKGTRPLTNEEIRKVRDAFDGKFVQRNCGLFMLGVSIGGRVSELLALTVGDVWQNGQPVSDFQFDKDIVKGGETSRTIPVNSDGRRAIEEIIRWHVNHFGGLFTELPPDTPLFPSERRDATLKRQAVHKILKKAFEKAGLNGKLATHTLRKTFAQRVYQNGKDIFLVQRLLGHKSVATTQAYLSINYATAQEVVEAMSLDAEDNPRDPLDAFPTGDLIEALIGRGYSVEKSVEGLEGMRTDFGTLLNEIKRVFCSYTDKEMSTEDAIDATAKHVGIPVGTVYQYYREGKLTD